jgi:hypothetical protein
MSRMPSLYFLLTHDEITSMDNASWKMCMVILCKINVGYIVVECPISVF